MNYRNITYTCGLGLLGIWLLSGCASMLPHNDNTIRMFPAKNGRVPLANDGRYANLYPDINDYPVTCDSNCHAPHRDVACTDAPQQCHYVGGNPAIETEHDVTLTWLGHASFVVEFSSGETFLFDPVSKQFDWPISTAFEWAGGHVRSEPVWLSEAQLASVDGVLYSHLHYDHFNKADIERMGNSPRYFVHQDTAEYLPNANLTVDEVSWYASSTLGDVEVHAVPAHHFNSRFWVPFIYSDDEKALWGGWLLEREETTVFFAGDTGYSDHFKDIAKRYGDIDICLMPIASYHHPENGRWYRYVHTTPEDALVAAADLNCKIMIPWGYGNASWQMGDVSSHSALNRLLHMRERMHSKQVIWVLNEGETVRL